MLVYLTLLDSDGDRVEFVRVYDQYRGTMLAVARGFFSDSARAEDAVHNAFLSVAGNFQKFLQIPCHERAPYLVTVVKNACRDMLRKEKKYAPWEEQSDLSRGRAPDTSALDEPYRRAVELLYALPDKYRAILELRLIEGYSNAEAAKRLGIPENTAAQQYNRARKKIAGQLEKEGLGLG